jgi:hypothetical protein
MLLGWLERHADLHGPGSPGLRAKAVMTIASTALPQVEKFCAAWGMTLERRSAGVAIVEGPALPVQGFSEITAMYRR